MSDEQVEATKRTFIEAYMEFDEFVEGLETRKNPSRFGDREDLAYVVALGTHAFAGTKVVMDSVDPLETFIDDAASLLRTTHNFTRTAAMMAWGYPILRTLSERVVKYVVDTQALDAE
jgi:hypothetical protein